MGQASIHPERLVLRQKETEMGKRFLNSVNISITCSQFWMICFQSAILTQHKQFRMYSPACHICHSRCLTPEWLKSFTFGWCSGKALYIYSGSSRFDYRLDERLFRIGFFVFRLVSAWKFRDTILKQALPRLPSKPIPNHYSQSTYYLIRHYKTSAGEMVCG
jgi:Pyruvate/2-oxoacid:ferredoxin oxidoreductase delta subunit